MTAAEFHFVLGIQVITVRKRSLRRLCFYTWLSFCSQGGSPGPYPGVGWGVLPEGGSPSPYPGGGWGVWLEGGLQAHIQGEVGGSGWRGGLQAHTQGVVRGSGWRGVSRPIPRGCIPACTEADPPSRRLLPRTVRILLECILVVKKVLIQSFVLGLCLSCRGYLEAILFLFLMYGHILLQYVADNNITYFLKCNVTSASTITCVNIQSVTQYLVNQSVIIPLQNR